MSIPEVTIMAYNQEGQVWKSSEEVSTAGELTHTSVCVHLA